MPYRSFSIRRIHPKPMIVRVRQHPVRIAGALVVIVLALAMIATIRLSGLADQTPISSPPDHPSNAAVELGRRLFYDRRLSMNEQMSCATCHRQELGFSDGRPVPHGVTGAPLRRNAPGLFNSSELANLTWADPALTTIEQQIARPLFAAHPPEMGIQGSEQRILDRLRSDPEYPQRFAAAFPSDHDAVTWARAIEALAAFTRSLNARETPYDRFLYARDQMAMTPSAQRGMALFFSAGLACGYCHVDLAPPERATAPAWGDLAYLSNGAGRSPDRGLAEQTGNPADAYRFRVPPLRNVAVTAPYMHDGSLATLDAVIRFYESGGRLGAGEEAERSAARHPLVAGFTLSDSERQDLIAFLESLTDQAALSAPQFSDPFSANRQATTTRRRTNHRAHRDSASVY